MTKTEKSVAEVLNAAADLLEKPGAWTQGAFARTGAGNIIGPHEAPAECFCGAGAIYRTCGPGRKAWAGQIIDSLKPHVRPHPNIAQFNDDPGRSQDQVVAVLRKAALAKASPPLDGGGE